MGKAGRCQFFHPQQPDGGSPHKSSFGRVFRECRRGSQAFLGDISDGGGGDRCRLSGPRGTNVSTGQSYQTKSTIRTWSSIAIRSRSTIWSLSGFPIMYSLLNKCRKDGTPFSCGASTAVFNAIVKGFVDTGCPVLTAVEYFVHNPSNSFVRSSTSLSTRSIGEISTTSTAMISDLRRTVGNASSVVK